MTKNNRAEPARARPTAIVLRTPLLPRDELERWSSGLATPSASDETGVAEALERDRELLRARLRALVLRPEIREAIFLASPALDESIDAWFEDSVSEGGQKTERSLVRYITRMAARPTPFGLFAGNTVCKLGESTRLELAGREQYRRYSRLDGDYLADLTDALVADPSLRPKLTYRPNSSLCRVADRLRYAQRSEGANRTYSLVSLEPSEYLAATLRRAEHGVLPAALATALCDDDAGVTPEEAGDFINELIDEQVLVSDLAPLVTGREAVDDVIEQLEQLDGTTVARDTVAGLRTIRRRLAELDRFVGNDPNSYRTAANALAALPAKVEIQRLFQVNLVPTGAHVQLGRNVIDEILRAVDILGRLSRPRSHDNLAQFRAAFVERYETREVPLAEVLDEESGIPFAASHAPSAATSPLLHDLMFPVRVGEPVASWGADVQHLATRIAEAIATGDSEVELEEADLAAMGASPAAPPTPDTLQVMVTLATTNHGDPRIKINGVGGPPSVSLLGRFAHSDPEMHDAIRGSIDAEEALHPDVVFAEVVHLAEGRLANISARPVLRKYEIVFLGRSEAPSESQIPLTDLMVSVRADRIVLRSRKLDREVVPRLSNAHNFHAAALGPYRFLASLQAQDQRDLSFDVGPLGALPHVPRIRLGKIILREASWRLRRRDLAPIVVATGAARVRALRELRARLGLPRWVCVEDGDNVLPVDLDNALCVDSFSHLVKTRDSVSLSELWPVVDELPVHGPDGRYSCELVIPFARINSDVPKPQPRSTPTTVGDPGLRCFPPGSDWLFLKLYTGEATGDRVLTEAIAPVVRELPDWFFIRYADPHGHIRLRVRGEPAWLLGALMPRLSAATQPLFADGRVWKLQLDTYEREVERYGGPHGIELAERLFHADSIFVIDLLGALSGDAANDVRWRLALLAIHSLLDDFGLDLAQRLELTRQMRDAFALEHGVSQARGFQRALGDLYRKHRSPLDALMTGSTDLEHELATGTALLSARSRANAPVIADLLVAERRGALTRPINELVGSLIHMQVNRLLRSAQRAHELVLYDLLARLYESRQARAKSSAVARAAADLRVNSQPEAQIPPAAEVIAPSSSR